ncbi:MAG: hypothetical protein WAV76_12890, partial [Bacteroidota bacterium]
LLGGNMVRTERQLQAAYEKGEISLGAFHEVKQNWHRPPYQGYCQEKEPGQHVIYQMVLKKGEKWKLNI